MAEVTDTDLEEALTFRLSAALPGEMRSNSPVPSPDRAVWELRLGERRAVSATGERFNRTAAVLTLVVALTQRVLRRPPDGSP